MKKKGFTLIELLAVIVILAVIMVIAVPKIIDVIESSRKSSFESGVKLIKEGIITQVNASELTTSRFTKNENGCYEFSFPGNDENAKKIGIKNKENYNGIVKYCAGKISYENLTDGKYKIITDENGNNIVGKLDEEIKFNGILKISKGSTNITYPETDTVEIIENTSKGKIVCESKDEEVATCIVNGNTVTLIAGKKEGNTTVTIKSEETKKYKEAKAAVAVITKKGILSVTAEDYEGVYDGKEHGITVISSGATITYGEVEETYDREESPKYTEAGEYTVYYKIEKEGYTTVKGSKIVKITKAEGSVSAPTGKTLTYTGNSQILINAGSTSAGEIQYKIEGGEYSTNLPEGINAGTYKVYYKVIGDNNHKDVSEKSINVVINKAEGSLTVSEENIAFARGSSKKITVTKVGGELSCTSASTTIATCTVNGNEIIVNGIKEGNTNITIKISETDNYKSNSVIKSVTIKVPVCKRASKLHTETCTQSDTRFYCSGAGYANGAEITYGNNPATRVAGTLVSGDAFDCDVTGTGNYERFYYVTDLEGNSNVAVLIYYNNFVNGEANNTSAGLIAYDSSKENWHGPVTAITNLPTKSQWKNVSLTNGVRAITNENGGNTTTNGENTLPSNFSYERYATRLLTVQEVNRACGITIGSYTKGELDSCNYLMENTKYSSSSVGNWGYWLENATASHSYYAWFVRGDYRYGDSFNVSYSSYYGVRPAIEVLKSDISY